MASVAADYHFNIREAPPSDFAFQANTTSLAASSLNIHKIAVK